MSGSGAELIRRFLQDVVAAEEDFGAHLLQLSQEGDDDEEVRAAYATHARETKLQWERIVARLQELGGAVRESKGLLGRMQDLSSKLSSRARVVEERTVRNLISAFAIEKGECAMYEALRTLAEAAGDLSTASLAREIQSEEQRAADRFWHFLPSRAKIALNMLTVDEIDPAVETKTAENRLI